MPLNDLTNNRYGRLLVLQRAKNDKWGHVQWLCICDCEKTVVVTANNLQGKNTRSCGCLRLELLKAKEGTTRGPYVIRRRRISDANSL